MYTRSDRDESFSLVNHLCTFKFTVVPGRPGCCQGSPGKTNRVKHTVTHCYKHIA